MKHAETQTLTALEPLLRQLRRTPGIRERAPGAFYLKSTAFLHFHEDPAGIFADLKINGAWKRLAVSSSVEKNELLKTIEQQFPGARL